MNLILTFNCFFYITYVYTHKTQLWYSFTASLVNSTLNLLAILVFVMFFYKVFNRLLFFSFFIKTSLFANKYSALVIPQQLLVGYNVIHPPLFYISFLVIIFSVFESSTFFRIINIMLCGFLALLLGGTWGLGNTVWGFFWVNDFIELILLSCLVVLILLQHISWNKSFPQFIFYFLFSLIVALLGARWGVLFTRHNFFSFNNIKNLILCFCYWYILSIPRSIYYCSFLFIRVFYVYIIIISLVYKFIQNIFMYDKLWVLLHIVFLLLSFSWLKTREHNLVYFLNMLQSSVFNYTYITDHWLYFFNYFFSLKNNLNNILNCSTLVVYGLKTANNLFNVSSSYFFFFFIIIFLISSIRKVYVSYVQS